jgi:hypothetical protein
MLIDGLGGRSDPPIRRVILLVHRREQLSPAASAFLAIAYEVTADKKADAPNGRQELTPKAGTSSPIPGASSSSQ